MFAFMQAHWPCLPFRYYSQFWSQGFDISNSIITCRQFVTVLQALSLMRNSR